MNMTTQPEINFKRIAEAIDFIIKNFKSQPDLDEIARQVHLSPAHFQRLFTEWAGTSPKKFLQYISVEHAKRILAEGYTSLPEVAYETGLSGTSRLHDLFVNIEGMTPAAYRDGGKNLRINYSFSGSAFGPVIIASTDRGVCHLAFEEDTEIALSDLIKRFPNAACQYKEDAFQQRALQIFDKDRSDIQEVKLHLKGTDFQLKVWESLLRIPLGQLTTYGRIAEQIGNSGASRAVGTAIGSNPVAFLIPCHRVIQSSGIFGGYMWGSVRKAAIIGWEGVRSRGDL